MCGGAWSGPIQQPLTMRHKPDYRGARVGSNLGLTSLPKKQTTYILLKINMCARVCLPFSMFQTDR